MAAGAEVAQHLRLRLLLLLRLYTVLAAQRGRCLCRQAADLVRWQAGLLGAETAGARFPARQAARSWQTGRAAGTAGTSAALDHLAEQPARFEQGRVKREA